MTKKLLNILLAATILFSSLICTTVFGEQPVSVKLDGTVLEFDVQPQIINGRTMVPLRTIFEALGAEVGWNEITSTVTATKPGYTVVLTINSPVMKVNDQKKTMDVSPILINDRTLIPARFVAEAFDCTVDWDEATYTVLITSASNTSYKCYPDSTVPDYSFITGAKLAKTESDETGVVYIYPLANNADGTPQWSVYDKFLKSINMKPISQSENEEFGGPIYGYLDETTGVVMGISYTAKEVWITVF